MPDTTNTKSDLEILTQLNADFVASAQNGDVRRYEQILAGISWRCRQTFCCATKINSWI